MRTILAACLLAACMVLAPALSLEGRDWKPTPADLARDYTMISHTKSDTELVMIKWIVPEEFDAKTVEDPIRQMLDDYVVIAVVHVKATPYGTFEVIEPGNIRIETGPNSCVASISPDGYPPVMAMALKGLRAIFSQLGVVGEGARYYVFDGTFVSSCKPGVLKVPYDGEVYDFVTPIPGCPSPTS